MLKSLYIFIILQDSKMSRGLNIFIMIFPGIMWASVCVHLCVALWHMSICAGVIRPVALQQIDHAPHGKARAQRDNKGLQGSNGRSKNCIYLRLCRSIQVEGVFALLKADFGFRRFLTRGKADVRAELFFPAMADNLKKRWMK